MDLPQGFVAPKVGAEFALHFITTPADGRFHVCRMVPGGRPIDVGSFATRDEAEEVRSKLDLANLDQATEQQPLPEDMSKLICRI
jgi:hypothetical protein